MEEVGGGPAGPFEDLEVVRVDAGMPTSRFCPLLGIPERTYRRWQAKARAGHRPKGPWPTPARDAHRAAVTVLAAEHPAWGHRKIWAMARHAGHRVTTSTVLRILDPWVNPTSRKTSRLRGRQRSRTISHPSRLGTADLERPARARRPPPARSGPWPEDGHRSRAAGGGRFRAICVERRS